MAKVRSSGLAKARSLSAWVSPLSASAPALATRSGGVVNPQGHKWDKDNLVDNGAVKELQDKMGTSRTGVQW